MIRPLILRIRYRRFKFGPNSSARLTKIGELSNAADKYGSQETFFSQEDAAVITRSYVEAVLLMDFKADGRIPLFIVTAALFIDLVIFCICSMPGVRVGSRVALLRGGVSRGGVVGGQSSGRWSRWGVLPLPTQI